MTSTPSRLTAPEKDPRRRRELWRVLVELHVLERELVERSYVRRADALERVGDALRRLEDVGGAGAMLAAAPGELGRSSEFARVLVSRVADRGLHAHGLWAGHDRAAASLVLGALQTQPVRLEYPLVEAEVAQRQTGEIVSVSAAPGRVDPAMTRILGWSSYALAPITLEGNTVGMIHADCGADGRAVDALDLEVLAQFAQGLGQALARALLHQSLRRHRQELHAAVQSIGRLAADDGAAVRPGPGAPTDDPLTPRELEVLRLVARGHTNQGIAGELFITEGTAKYHVKNILRKLQATSRADAVARYMRLAPDRLEE